MTAQASWRAENMKLGAHRSSGMLPCCPPAFPRTRSAVVCGARRDDRDKRWGTGSGAGASVSALNTATLPKELLQSHWDEQAKPPADTPLTVYSVRFSTGHGRGAALSEPHSAVNVCLVGKDGRAVLHRISPLNDPQKNQQEVEQLCQIIDDPSIGADCRIYKEGSPEKSSPSPGASGSSTTSSSSTKATSSSSSSSGASGPTYGSTYVRPPPQPRLRFQEGCVDEVCFLGPELGPLSSILVGPEAGSWVLREVHVASSRTHHTDRFVCQRLLGGGQGAGLLTPVPPGAVVYGSGDSAVVLSKDQASTIHAMSMSEYENMKTRLITTTAVLAAAGSGIAAIAAGPAAAGPFALGGLAGVTYLWLLQQGVDSIVVPAGLGSATANTPAQQGSPKSSTTTVDFVEVDEYGDIVIQPQTQQKNTPRQQPQSKSSSGSKPMRGGSSNKPGAGSSSSGAGRNSSSSGSSGSWQSRDFSTRSSMEGEGQAAPQQGGGATSFWGPGTFRRLGQTSPAPPSPSPHAAAASAAGAAGAAQGSAARKLLSHPAVRVAFLGALTLSAVTLVGGGAAPTTGTSSPANILVPLGLGREQLWQLVVALLGFMTYKVALVSVSLTAPPAPPKAMQAAGVQGGSSARDRNSGSQ